MQGKTREGIVARINVLKAKGAAENARLIKKWERKLRQWDKEHGVA